LEKDNLSMTCDVTHEMFWSQKVSKTFFQDYFDFKMHKELKMLLPISLYVKKIQKQRDQLACLNSLGGFCAEYASHVIEGSETRFKIFPDLDTLAGYSYWQYNPI